LGNTVSSRLSGGSDHKEDPAAQKARVIAGRAPMSLVKSELFIPHTP